MMFRHSWSAGCHATGSHKNTVARRQDEDNGRLVKGAPIQSSPMRLHLPTRSLRWQFEHNDGRMMDKWLHYFDIYERHLAPYRGRKITVLEIGVSHGGSLQMWRRYFGHRSTIVGVDIEPRVVELAERGIELHVGDQSDPAFLQHLADRYGRFDVVIDDGSHLPPHQIASITHLWPHLAEGGVYLVEDLHTNYWGGFYESCRGNPASFISWLTARIDDMHAFHSQEPDFVVNEWTSTLGGLHVYDSIVVLDKTKRQPPVSRKSGRPMFEDIYGYEANELIDEHHRAQLTSLSSPTARLRRAWREPRGTFRRVRGRFGRS